MTRTCALCHQSTDHLPDMSIANIVAKVAALSDISPSHITGRRRYRTYAHPRLAVYYLAYKHTQKSFPQIAQAIGNRDHTTVFDGERKARELLQTCPDFADLIARFEAPEGQGVLL